MEAMTTTCGPIPGGFILTHAHLQRLPAPPRRRTRPTAGTTPAWRRWMASTRPFGAGFGTQPTDRGAFWVAGWLGGWVGGWVGCGARFWVELQLRPLVGLPE